MSTNDDLKPRNVPLDVKPGDVVESTVSGMRWTVVEVTELDMFLDDGKQVPLVSPVWRKKR